MRFAVVGLLLSVLPGCVAAIGNTGYDLGSYPKTTIPLLQERVEAARRIVELREQHLATLQTQQASGTLDMGSVFAAQIAIEEAKLVLLQCRAELSAVQARKHDDDHDGH